MPKKTFYTKEELAEQKTTEESNKTVEKTVPQIKNIKIDKVETEIEKELNDDIIVQKKPIRIKRRARATLMDSNGNKLKKDGTIDRRGEVGMQNLQKSKVYQQILEKKKLKEHQEKGGKVAILTPYAESSDSETEFETEKIKLEIEPEEPTPTPVSKGTDDFIRKQEAQREKELGEQLKAMELENKKLKDSFHYNSHLNRMQALSTNVKLKF